MAKAFASIERQAALKLQSGQITAEQLGSLGAFGLGQRATHAAATRSSEDLLAEESKYQESKNKGVMGAVNKYATPVIKAVAPYAMAAMWAGAAGFGPLASGGSMSSTALAGGEAAAGGTAAGTAISSTPAKMAGSSTLLGGTTTASTAATTTFAGATGGALGASTIPTATLTAAEVASGSVAGTLGLSSSGGAAKTATAAKTGITATDYLTAASLASSLATPRMPEMPGPIDPPDRGDVDMPKNRTEQMALRAQDLGRQARAAGAQRGENEADLLGSMYGPKRKGQARRALSGL